MSKDVHSESRLPCPKVESVPAPLMSEYLNLVGKPNVQFKHNSGMRGDFNVSDGHDSFRILANSTKDARKPENIRLIQKVTAGTEQIDTYEDAHRINAFYKDKAGSFDAKYEGDIPHVNYMTGFITSESGKKVEYAASFDGAGKRQEFNAWTDEGLTSSHCEDK